MKCVPVEGGGFGETFVHPGFPATNSATSTNTAFENLEVWLSAAVMEMIDLDDEGDVRRAPGIAGSKAEDCCTTAPPAGHPA